MRELRAGNSRFIFAGSVTASFPGISRKPDGGRTDFDLGARRDPGLKIIVVAGFFRDELNFENVFK